MCIWKSFLVSFILVIFLNKSVNFSIIRLFPDLLFSANQMFLIVRLNFFSQSIPSSGVKSFLSVIRICIFCCSRIQYLPVSLPEISLRFCFILGISVSLFVFRLVSICFRLLAILMLAIRCSL